MIQFIFGLLALVGGVIFMVKYRSIEKYFFSDDSDEPCPSGIGFMMTATAISALAMGYGIIVNMFDLHVSNNAVLYVGLALVVVVLFGAMAHAAFASRGFGEMLGRMLFMTVSVAIGALMGAAGSVLVFLALCLVFLFAVLKGALSSSGGGMLSQPAPSAPSVPDDEMEISVPGEMFNRRARETGFGDIVDDHGVHWERGYGGELHRKE